MERLDVGQPGGRAFTVLILVTVLGMASPPGDLAAAPQAHDQVGVVIRLDGGAGLRAPLPVALRFIPTTGESATAPSRMVERRIEAPGRTAVDLSGSRVWRLEVTAGWYWAPPAVVTPEQQEEPLAVVLFPTGKVRGKIEMAAGASLPARLEVSFEAAPQEEAAVGAPETTKGPPSGSASCPVARDGWQCEIPAGRLDLRLKADGFVPVYVWGLDLEPKQTADLGLLRLRQGASISGWVETEADARPLAGSEVRLFVETAGTPTNLPTMERLENLDSVTPTDERGFFQLQGVPPGQYGLELRHPGYAPAALSPVEVQAGRESQVLEPVRLGTPVTLEAVVFPPLDQFGRRWELDLYRMQQGRFAESFRGRASAEGIWSRGDLPPGAYRLRVADEDGSRWAHREVRLAGERVSEIIEIDLVEVRGELTLGDEPVAAEIWFESEHGARRVRFAADLEGQFEGFLSEEGRWPVEIFLQPGGGRRLAIDPVEVRRRKGKGYAEVAIRIPDTLLQGEVVDEEGRPVAGAAVEVLGGPSDRGGSTTVADEEGRFEVRGLPEGRIVVQAESNGAVSDWVPVHLDEDGTPPDLRLELRRQQRIAGEVASDGGPVPGAWILALPDAATSAAARLVQAVTGPTGEFQLTLPASATSAALIVVAPRFATRILRMTTGSPEPWSIRVEAPGGTLVIPGSERPELGPRRSGLLFHGGVGVPVVLLQRLLPSDLRPDGMLALANLEAGDYTLCPSGSAMQAFRDGGAATPEDGCAGGFLFPLSELVLQANPPAAPAGR